MEFKNSILWKPRVLFFLIVLYLFSIYNKAKAKKQKVRTMKTYQLLNKNKIVATFKITGSGMLESVSDVKKLDQLPFWMEDVESWLSNRGAAKHRASVKKILQICQADNLSGFISLTNCLSLQDTFWVREDKSGLTWEQVNLFDNEFSEVMTKMAFDGTGLFGIKLRVTSPELTTDGNYEKCWVRKEDSIYLLKSGSSGARNAGLEPYCEVLASQFYEKFCSGVVYDIENYHDKVVSSCKSFVTEEYGYKPISLWLQNGMLKNILDTISQNGCDTNAFARMIVADSVMVNSDRHFGNFGFLVDNQDHHIISLAPAFDYNLALSPYAEIDIDFPRFDDYLLERGPAIGGEYIQLAKTLLTPEMKSDLINLKDLELTLPEWCFEPHKYQFTKKRLEIANEIKNVQIDRILGDQRSFSFVSDKQDVEEELE